jgi:hypothetical protein
MTCGTSLNTLTIFKVHESSYIFGGFTSIDWNSSSGPKADPKAFLFSLTTNSGFGPIFGFGHDLRIRDSSNTRIESYSYLGNSYEHPQPSQGLSYLAGSNPFQLSEIEVYQKK